MNITQSDADRRKDFVAANEKHLLAVEKHPIVIPATLSHLDMIVQVHLEAFEGFFLESLGEDFLRQLYRAFISEPSGLCLVAIEDERVVGFVVGTTQPEGFFRRLLLTRWPAFLMSGAAALLTHPIRVGKKFFSAIHYRGERPADVLDASLLSSIGVAAKAKGRGIGRELISAFCESAQHAGSSAVFLTTDRDGNDAVKQFYLSNGFRLHSSFLKDRNRFMNLYVRSFLGSFHRNQPPSVTREGNSPSGSQLKRFFDLFVSGIALMLLSPLMFLLAILVRLGSPGPAIFRQTRVGMGFRTFQLLKFRSMTNGSTGVQITCGADARITRLGAVLRKFKLDELPQLWNVFCGDMSFVGPRPEVPTFVEQFRTEYAEILCVRPGITDPASILYRAEADILGRQPDPISHYTEVILPHKIEISRQYVHTATFRKDIAVIFQTIFAVFSHDSEEHSEDLG